MGKKINFIKNEKVISKNQKIKKITYTIKKLKEIERDNDMQNNYVSMYWRELYKYKEGEYTTIDENDYNELSQIAEDIMALQTRLAFKLEKMIDKCVNKIENV